MTQRVLILNFRVVVLALICSTAGVRGQQQQHRIDGLVVDDQDKPIAAVRVTAYRGDNTAADDTTGPDGKYTLRYPIGPTITKIIYENSSWNAASIAEVSGNRDHIINKVLRRVGSDLPAITAVDTLDTYLTLFYIVNGAESNPSEKAERRGKYANALRALKIPRDSALQQTKDRLMALYGVQ